MSKTIIHNMKISGISVVLGENKKEFANEPEYYNYDEKQLLKLKKMIGFNTRYWVNPETTTYDLCGCALRRLINKMNIDIKEINAIIFATQTPDYYMPGNAHIIHREFGFDDETTAVDLELGCSGYIYGLWLAGMMINSGLKKVLLLTGDTLSKIVNKKDKTEAPLFGDAGSATLVEYDKKAPDSYFILKSDGKGVNSMLQPAGAYRVPSSDETRMEMSDKDGNIRSAENIYMNGFEIFNFTLTKQPKMLDEILAYSKNTKDDIDYFVLHQANVYIVQTILKKTGISFEKAPSNVFEKFGNQNSASIPSAICSELSNCFENTCKKVLLQGFGIGLSWGACVTNFENTLCLEPEIYKK